MLKEQEVQKGLCILRVQVPLIFDGNVVLQISVIPLNGHIHANECSRQSLCKDKGLCK